MKKIWLFIVLLMVNLSSMAQVEPMLEFTGFTISEYRQSSFNLYLLTVSILLIIYPIVFWTSLSIKKLWAQGPKIISGLLWISIIIVTPIYIIPEDIYFLDMIDVLTMVNLLAFDGRSGIVLVLYILAVTFLLLSPMILPKDRYSFNRVASISMALLVLLVLPQILLFESAQPLIVPLFSVTIILGIIRMTKLAKTKNCPATE